MGLFSMKISKEWPFQLMENEFLFTKIEEDNIGSILFHHDEATWQTAEATLDV